MKKIIPCYVDPIYGVTVKSDSFYVIRNKRTFEYDINDGEQTDDIMEANWYCSYQDAKEELKTFDEPEEFDIIRFNCTCSLEEVM